MKLKAKNSAGEGDFRLPEAGTHRACLQAIYDIGTQPGGTYEPKHQCIFVFELPDEEGDEPVTISKFYTWSLHEKSALRKHLEAWRGKALDEGEEFDFSVLLGKTCMVSLQDYTKGSGDRGVKVIGLSKLPKGLGQADLKGDPEIIGMDQWDEAWAEIPEWVQKIIQKSAEWQARSGGAAAAPAGRPDDDGDEDNIPF